MGLREGTTVARQADKITSRPTLAYCVQSQNKSNELGFRSNLELHLLHLGPL